MVGRAILQESVQERLVVVEEEYWCVGGATGVGEAVAVGRVEVRRVVVRRVVVGEGRRELEEEAKGRRSLVRTMVGNMGIGATDGWMNMGMGGGRWSGDLEKGRSQIREAREARDECRPCTNNLPPTRIKRE